MIDFIDEIIKENATGPITADLEMAMSYLITAKLKLERGSDNDLDTQVGIALQIVTGAYEATLKARI